MSTFEAVPRARAPRRLSATSRQFDTAREIRRLVIALAALAALVISVVAIATQPQTTLLHREVTSLTTAVSSGRRQISALRASLMRTSAQSTRLEAVVGSLSHRVGAVQAGEASLGRRTGAIEGSVRSVQDRALALAGDVSHVRTTEKWLGTQSRNLLTCVPQLQQELGGLTVQITKVRGRVVRASVANVTTVSKDCTKTLFGP